MRSLSDAAASVWAKSPRQGLGWLPLWQHLSDSAAVAARLWDEWLPAATRETISKALPGGVDDGRRLVRWLAGVHDIGKATPAFAVQVPFLAERMRREGLSMPDAIAYQERKLAMHATAGQLLLEEWLRESHGWDLSQARQFSVIVGGHHGVPPSAAGLGDAQDRPALLGTAQVSPAQWRSVQRELMDWAAATFEVNDRLPEWRFVRLSQAAQVIVTGLIIVADWVASNEELFSYDEATFGLAERADTAWAELDLPTPWRAVAADESMDELLSSRFGLAVGVVARPVQVRAVELARRMPTAGVLIVEAPMGEGKTEAALAAAEVLAERSGAGGCFVALPTRATSDAMFHRVLTWLGQLPDADPGRGALPVTLAHGKARFNDDYRSLMRGRVVGVAQDAAGGGHRERELAAHQWLTGRKKAMLSSFVVGTIDQLLFAALKSRHVALRHLGLAGKVVIIDEAHAYDVYMGQYLDRALEWLAAYGVPTIILSATLPAKRRRELVEAYERGRNPGAELAPRRRSWRDSAPAASPAPVHPLEQEIGYPVLVASGPAGVPLVETAEPSGRETAVVLERIEDDLPALAQLLGRDLHAGGCALVICNTVRRVHETAETLREALAPAGIDVSVAHSRFLAPDRAAKDQWLRDHFGPPDHCAVAGTVRPSSHVVVASQVAEQSLDIDFDLLVTDLAPADLLLQRMGRLHRHPRGKDQQDRPQALQQARCVLRGVADWSTQPPQPVAGSVRVYQAHPLLRSLAVLHETLEQGGQINLPADIAPLVQTAYGDSPIGPPDWGASMAEAQHRHQELYAEKERRARTFRLGGVGDDGEPIVGWLDANVGDADDDRRGRAQVRDTPAESVEVHVLVRRLDGTLITPPWLLSGGGKEVSTERTPDGFLGRTIASCTLSLPIELSTEEAIEELERRNDYEAWQHSPWLTGQLILDIDEQGHAELAGYQLHYDRLDGLALGRTQ
ncbi:CRISPR-associated helicase Cas3' [Natronosporangium hydrolyticum]|uniref:CRISPR-associated helicase Cas3' n=1 Tax=Natronosporangium hydrolyticum TaxID=2811111 RepID=UPI001EFA1F49|nr:CRISPR-associated helicase Cas3' [Natronosporangium hydrolyticum]